ncbi:MAG TPA: hypothetical protein EYH02_04670 [Ignisphaera aggregans]|uniref:Mut7-C RNAse domain-containing protein n=1 Tax=Ignisphaera aggregans TaxID=334771 RepID=A0A832YYU9_9CREN|nr:hypothetical protein [Ignisphaera aggregans]
MPDYPRFIVDSMLGHVARWLRLLGYDTLYFRDIEDWKLLKIAEEEDRILLTRDLGLFRRARKRGLRALFIEDPSIERVLALLSARYGIRLEFEKHDTRCPECNAKLRYTTSLVELSGKVSSYIATKYKEFWVCSSCGKVYWQGRHWKSIEKSLEIARYERAKIQSRLKPREKAVSMGNLDESA